MAMRQRKNPPEVRGEVRDVFSIEPVPAENRGGSVVHMAAFWFVANISLGAIVTGMLAITLGLSLAWAIISIVVGNFVGAVFMAYHAAQGPKLGLPQMVQSRAQFGVFGALLPIAIALCIYLGFYINGAIHLGLGLQALLHIPLVPAIWIGAVLSLSLVIVGYNLIQRYARYLALPLIAVFVVITVRLGGSEMVTTGSSHWTVVMLMIGIAAGWQLTWAPYVSDYSRYLPATTSTAKAFIFAYVGSAVGATWMMIVGVMGAAVAPTEMSANPAGYLGSVFSVAPWLVYFMLAAPLIQVQAATMYSGFLSAIAGLYPSTKVPQARLMRIISALIVASVGTVVGIALRGNYLELMFNFILFVSYLIIPWTAINILDFYVVRRRGYVLADLYDWRGRYGAVQVRPIVTYLVALAAEIPFINSSFFEGPLSKAFDGADFSWLVGLAVSSILYMVWVAPTIRRRESAFDAAVPSRVDASGPATIVEGSSTQDAPVAP